MTDKSKLQNKPRLGLINYINCLPIVLPILNGLVELDAEIILGEPSKLNSLFAASQLEYGAMSAFAFLEQSDNLTLIPTVSISSERAVNSVLLFSKKAIEQIFIDYEQIKIAVPSGSATSVNAMLLMLAKYGKRPILNVVEKPSLEDEYLNAALVIGDRALLVDKDWSQKYFRYDLGQWWHETFNLPMVFGVFAVRTNWFLEQDAKINKGLLVECLGQSLAKAAKIGLSDYFVEILDEAQARTSLSRKRLEQYYRIDLDFSWSDRHQQAISKYESLCHKMGMLESKKVLA
jgi:chorismate dehydratase